MPTRTGFVYHDDFLKHDTGRGHPERPERLTSIISHLQQTGYWQRIQHIDIPHISEEWILKVHTKKHVNLVRDACQKDTYTFDDGDTHVCRDSFHAALLAASGVIAGVDAVMNGTLNNVFCAVRPPGHHAESNAVMGFCLFNNVAIGAHYAQEAHGVGRVAIIDWDVHHGNGTQEIFYADKSVFYISTHQYPFYPGTGSRDERGTGEGLGYTLNIPMNAGSGEKEYLNAFVDEILPALDGFRPELIILSAGFDAHKDDPLANINLTEHSFAKLTTLVREAAEQYCNGRIVSVLEGGYNIHALAQSVATHLTVLMQ